MGLTAFLINVLLSIAVVLVDIAFVLHLVRLLRQWSSNRVLVAFDTAGEPIVGWMTEMSDKLWRILRVRRQLSRRGRLLVAMLILALSRGIIMLFFTH